MRVNAGAIFFDKITSKNLEAAGEAGRTRRGNAAMTERERVKANPLKSNISKRKETDLQENGGNYQQYRASGRIRAS